MKPPAWSHSWMIGGAGGFYPFCDPLRCLMSATLVIGNVLYGNRTPASGILITTRSAVMNYATQIRELCSNALAAKDDNELEKALSELRTALREHSLATENQLYSYPVLKRDPEVVLG